MRLRSKRTLLRLVPGVALLLAGLLIGQWALAREYPPEGSPDEGLTAAETTGGEAVAPQGESTDEGAASGSTGTAVQFVSSEGPIGLRQLDAEMLQGNFVRCPECHTYLDRAIRNQEALTPAFKHGFHLEAGATCDDCHESPTHSAGGVKRPPMEKCFDCHAHDDATAPPGDCATCHPEGFSLEPASHEDPEWLPVKEKMDAVQGKHTATSTSSLGDCAICHSEQFCRDCHQMDMPHPDEWQDGHAETGREVGGSACIKCHPDRESCKSCHHTGYEPGGRPWVELHYEAADSEGVQKCIGCHSTKTCAHCHTTGNYREYE